jgi:acetylglutamate kinase
VTPVKIVVKLGGEMIARDDIAHDIHALTQDGHRVIVSHGGGPQATALSKRLGLEPQIIGGRRVTDAATLDVMKMVIAGQANVDLCARLRAAGLQPVGVHDAVRAVKRPPRRFSGGGDQPIDLGFVGDVTEFDLPLLDRLLDGGYLPVVACLGHDAQGGIYNINADIVANELAAALKADALLLVTGTPGVLRDVADRDSRIPKLTRTEADRAIADGVVSEGMIPKLEEAFAALERGVGAVHILAGELGRSIREPGSVGTVLIGS